MDVEDVMHQLGRAGVSVIVKMDHERAAEGSAPWTVVMFGPPLGESAVRNDAAAMASAVEHCLDEVRRRQPSWTWL